MPHVSLLLFACALFSQAAGPPAGRWEGQIQVPGDPMRIVIDLSPIDLSPSHFSQPGLAQKNVAQWRGSAILPGLGIKGTPLSEIAVKDNGIAFTAREMFGGATFNGRLAAGNRLTGTCQQGGNNAAFMLQLVGAAQVDEPPHSTAIDKNSEGVWVGEMNLFDRQVKVRLTLLNAATESATAQLVLNGRKETVLKPDLVTEEEGFLTVNVTPASITYEGRLDRQSNTIVGTFANGPYEAPLTLRRSQ